MAPNGSAGCLLQGGDKSLCAGSSGPAGSNPNIARLPADVWHAKHGLEIRRHTDGTSACSLSDELGTERVLLTDTPHAVPRRVCASNKKRNAHS